MVFYFFIFIFILGTTIGSFLNVIIDRPIKGKSILGRSKCDYCGKKLLWYDMFPVISFFLLKGKSRCCQKKLSWQYPLVEFLTGLTFILVFFFNDSFYKNLLETFFLLGIISCFIVIFVSDFKYHLIADGVLIGLFVFSLFFNLNNYFLENNLFLLKENFVSGLVVGLPIFLIYFLSKERAMGLGDVYLSAIIGFLLGWKKGFLALYIAFLLGAIFGLMLILLKKKKLKSKIAFGPFIVIGSMTMLFYGDKIIEFIRKSYGL